MTLQQAIKRLALMLALLPTVAPNQSIDETAADLENALCNLFDAAARENRPPVDAIAQPREIGGKQ